MEKTLWEIYNDTQLAELETLTADYKNFWMQEKQRENV